MISIRVRALSAVHALDLHLNHGVPRPFGADPANVLKLAGQLTGVAYASDRTGMTAAAADLRALIGDAS